MKIKPELNKFTFVQFDKPITVNSFVIKSKLNRDCCVRVVASLVGTNDMVTSLYPRPDIKINNSGEYKSTLIKYPKGLVDYFVFDKILDESTVIEIN